MKKILILFIGIMLFSTAHSQKNLSVVAAVDLERYSGTWYEIVRKPFFYESKLKCITAQYTLRPDGRITVLNRGYYIKDPTKSNEAKGVALIPDKNVPGKLKVQFFWPFRGNYWILELDGDYRYVLIGEPSFKYLWVLARENKLDQAILDNLLKKAADAGYDLSDLIITDQDCP
jgi:apolipoprotein D and lipocalin family protein